jgi:predicted regulator of Ras-like GTPase activity (Roadblock/LC7/MglB family)
MKELMNMPQDFNLDLLKSSKEQLPIQIIIEDFMKQVVKLGNYETAHIFDQDGLVIAKYSDDKTLSDQKALEISILMKKFSRIMQSMGRMQNIDEIVLEDAEKKKIVIRFFKFLQQQMILVLVVAAGKSYKGLTNRLERILAKFSQTLENEPK